MMNKEILEADVIFVSHSGGKDSQAMLAYLVKQGLKDKIVVVHSDLGEMEWEPMHNFIERNSFGLPVNVVKPPISFFELCRKYGRLPSGNARFCTMYLKTKPIAEFIHKYMTEHGFTKSINATGIRADESDERAKKTPFGISDMTQPKKYPGHIIHDWMPIFDFTLDQVWLTIAGAGQIPHEVYSRGYSRLSCVFCPLGKVNEHKMMAIEKPELFNKMVALEKELGKSIRIKTIKGVKYHRYLDGTIGNTLKKA